MGKYDVGTIHETKNNGQLEIIERLSGNRRRVRFVKTGYVTLTRVSQIASGLVRDVYVPSVYGVGIFGVPIDHPLRKELYERWTAMLQRVYVFKTGKTIDSEWHCFANFMRDALELKGIELLYQHSKSNRIDLDSDMIPRSKGEGPKYSKETCQWVRHADNVREIRSSCTCTKHPIGSVFETNHGPVTIIDKADRKWLIEFDDGSRKWAHSVNVKRGLVRKPKAD